MFLVTVIVPHHRGRMARLGASQNYIGACAPWVARFISIRRPRSPTSIIVLGVVPITAAQLPALSETSSQRRVSRDDATRAIHASEPSPASSPRPTPLTRPAVAVKTQLKISPKFGATCACPTPWPRSSRPYQPRDSRRIHEHHEYRTRPRPPSWQDTAVYLSVTKVPCLRGCSRHCCAVGPYGPGQHPVVLLDQFHGKKE